MEECLQVRLKIAECFRNCQKIILALGDETRQHMIMTLLESEQIGLRVGEITAKTHLSRPAVSHHLKILREAQIVSVHRQGTMNFYYINTKNTGWEKLKDLADQICTVIHCANQDGYPGLEAEEECY